MTIVPEFTGYCMEQEDREALASQCIEFDVMSLVCGDVPDTRGIKDMMRRDDQGRINSCGGFGMAHAAAVVMFNQTQTWRTFNPMWSYRRGQIPSNIRGDHGVTISGLIKAAMSDGVLPEDFDNDGQVETKYREDYNMSFPPESAAIARQWLIGYSIQLDNFDKMLRFLQSGQGAIVIGGPWGNWSPNSQGIADNFRGGGGGHARAYIDWITINGQVYLVEANSHYKSYGDNGFAYHSKRFVDAQCRDQWFVATGVSDLKHPVVRRVLTRDEIIARIFSRGLVS